MPDKKTGELLRELAWPIHNMVIYEEALTHTSFAHEAGNRRHNERLEFLGDAVLELVISEYLFKSYPGYPEGKLTQMRHSIVNEKSLAGLARQLNLGEYIKLGKGESTSGGAEKASLLADALEALIGALFLDTGYVQTGTRVIALFEPMLEALEKGLFPLADFKTMLQEKCQSLTGKTPVYSIIKEVGPQHDKTFEAAAELDDMIIGLGTGKTKKEAEQAAAKAAWEQLIVDVCPAKGWGVQRETDPPE
ncbi:MAG: ribonuclease III [Bacillota bacterium]